MRTLAIIGGSGINRFSGAELIQTHAIETPYGRPSADIGEYELETQRFYFFPRHGDGHRIPPHQINYRANMAALKLLGVEVVVACNSVGGLNTDMGPGALVIPDQIIDYSYGREHTFSDNTSGELNHIDFTEPYSRATRHALLDCADALGLTCVDYGTYACTQGPRLETAAEIRRLQRDGCDLVGMTGMPEAALARELGLEYAAICMVANWAAGLTDEPLSLAAMERELHQSCGRTLDILRSWLVSNRVRES